MVLDKHLRVVDLMTKWVERYRQRAGGRHRRLDAVLDVPMVRIIRFLAHTDPDLVVQWNGPNGTDMSVDHWDCRSGGSFCYLHIIDGVALEHWYSNRSNTNGLGAGTR